MRRVWQARVGRVGWSEGSGESWLFGVRSGVVGYINASVVFLQRNGNGKLSKKKLSKNPHKILTPLDLNGLGDLILDHFFIAQHFFRNTIDRPGCVKLLYCL
jgi:hypothetical protein